MKEKRKKYEKPQSYTIEMEEPLMNNVSIGISTETENKPGRLNAPHHEFEDDRKEDDWEEDDWEEDDWDE